MTSAQLQNRIQMYREAFIVQPKQGFMNPEDAEQLMEELMSDQWPFIPYQSAGLQIYGVDFLKIPTLPKGSVAFRHP